MTLRPYQHQAIESWIRHQRGIWQIPAGGGKTRTAIAGASCIAETMHGASALWIAHTVDQIDQARTEFQSLSPQHLDMDFQCAASSTPTKPYKIVIVDECHRAGAPSWESLIRAVTPNAQYVLGLSATPNRPDDKAQTVFDLLGEIIFQISRQELQDLGFLAAGHVVFLTPNYPKEFQSQVEESAEIACRKWSWMSEDKFHEMRRRELYQAARRLGIIENAKRFNCAVDVSREHVNDGDSVLIITPSIEKGKEFAQAIDRSELVHSKASGRSKIIARFSDGKTPCLIATSLADEGLDIPRANILILYANSRSSRLSEQRTGRVLRTFHGKAGGIIYDFLDHQCDQLLWQSYARRKDYKRLGYEVFRRA